MKTDMPDGRIIHLGLRIGRTCAWRRGERYLTVEGSDFAWMTRVEDRNVDSAMRFVAKVRDRARRG